MIGLKFAVAMPTSLPAASRELAEQSVANGITHIIIHINNIVVLRITTTASLTILEVLIITGNWSIKLSLGFIAGQAQMNI